MDWLAAGLPSEGREASQPAAMDVARNDVPTCSLDDTIGQIKARTGTSPLTVCVVVNAARVVLGILREEELRRPDDTRAEDAMRSGPSTFRPHVPIHEMARYLAEHDMDEAPITTGDGRLIGVLFREDAERVANQNG